MVLAETEAFCALMMLWLLWHCSHINTELQHGVTTPGTLSVAQRVHTTLSHSYFLVFALGKEGKTFIATADGPASGEKGHHM